MESGSPRDRLRRALVAWDPAARLGSPEPAAVERWRRSLAAAAPAVRPRPSAAPLGWAAASALALAALLVLATLRLGGEGPRPSRGPQAAARPVRLELRASNGARIYWVVRPGSEPAGSRRSR
jgi:hypothetical protein